MEWDGGELILKLVYCNVRRPLRPPSTPLPPSPCVPGRNEYVWKTLEKLGPRVCGEGILVPVGAPPPSRGSIEVRELNDGAVLSVAPLYHEGTVVHELVLRALLHFRIPMREVVNSVRVVELV